MKWLARFRWLLAMILIPVAVVAVFYRLNKDGFFDLKRIEIVLVDTHQQDLFLKPRVEVLDQYLESFRGRSMWQLDLDKVSKRISQYNWIEKYELTRKWPSTLTVQVKPFEVKALLMNLGKGEKFVPVIRDGKPLDAIEASIAPDVAVLDGAVFAQPELRKKAVQMLEEVPTDGTFSRKVISEVRWSSKDGFYARMVKTGIQVKLGEDRFGIKSIRVGQVLDYLGNRGIKAESVDANLSKKVLVRLDPASRAAAGNSKIIE